MDLAIPAAPSTAHRGNAGNKIQLAPKMGYCGGVKNGFFTRTAGSAANGNGFTAWILEGWHKMSVSSGNSVTGSPLELAGLCKGPALKGMIIGANGCGADAPAPEIAAKITATEPRAPIGPMKLLILKTRHQT
jgi:hypothetical protein